MVRKRLLRRITIPTVEQDSTAKSSKTKSSQLQVTFKWERRKRASDAYAPSLRSGCTMALWNRSGGAEPTGILFGGVTDEDTSEETLESVFHNDMYVLSNIFYEEMLSLQFHRFGYQISGKGKWISMALRKPKAKGGKKAVRVDNKRETAREASRREQDSDQDEGEEEYVMETISPKTRATPKQFPPNHSPEDKDPNDPMLTVPIPRYNAMLAVLRNTLYM
jgi:hypothetical protein